ncbi:hypothetical protein MKW98_021521 [Papaver atlanticum]|uniref:Uncharacterized protein n=1 Tax=Papaver atlanticum TaxID=357466 RepID=A0AAD4SQE1_9MAGN|nr:hypothetical protein MKW98_021521 [Papaver atlanticum]
MLMETETELKIIMALVVVDLVVKEMSGGNVGRNIGLGGGAKFL